MGYIREYSEAYLLFVFECNGQLWGQFDTSEKYLPRYKSKASLDSPNPGSAFIDWKNEYSRVKADALRVKAFAFTNSVKSAQVCEEKREKVCGVGVGVGIGIGETHVQNVILNTLAPDPPFAPIENGFQLSEPPTDAAVELKAKQVFWFQQFWAEYWRKAAKKPAEVAFCKNVKCIATFDAVMAAVNAQKPVMLARDPEKRPHAATWLNGERWLDEPESVGLVEGEPQTKRLLM